MWRRRRKAASARLSAALYSVYHGLYSEAVVSSAVSAVALVDVGRFREAVEYVQKAAKTLYEAVKEVFERVKVSLQRLVELFVEAVTRVLAWVDKHRAYLFLMAAVAAGVIALGVALNIWGLIELENLACAASAAPFFAGLADAGGKAAERFKTLAERWKVNDNEEQKIENLIKEIINAPLNRERPFLKLSESANLPEPLVELRRALKRAEDMAKIDEVVKDAAVVAALVLYKTLINNAKAYEEWAGWYEWARGLVKGRKFAVKVEEVERLRGAQKRLEEVAEQVRRELNSVLALYASHSRDLYEKLRPHLEVDVEMVKRAEELAVARSDELSKYSNANMGAKVYTALLSVARGGIYGHAATLLMMEGALADIVLLTPTGAYEKVWEIAKGRGEAVDPSRVGAASWEDRAASALLRYLLGRAVSEDLVFRRVKGGFEVFRAYGGIETRVDVLKIGESAARSKAGEEELRRFMEEAKRTAPDLSGLDTSSQYLEWRATDVSTTGKQIEAATAHLWQLRWYLGLLGKEESSKGSANVTREGTKLAVTAYWPREREDDILSKSRWLESLLGRRVESWRELVDAIDWSWVLKRVEELVDELKSWIGPERASYAEREGRARRMLGELALLTHFAEARRGMDDGRWREERTKRLARAVEALSGGRIAGDHANELAQAIIRYAEGRKKKAKKSIESLAEEVGVSRKELWSFVDFVLSDMYCLARDCADDKIVRKFVAPALELVMLDKALNDNNDPNRERNREEPLLRFGEMYATALAGDGTVGRRSVMLAVGGELGGGAVLLRLATLHLLNRLLPDELKFNVRIYVVRGRYYYIAASGENAVGLMRFLAVTAPSASGEYLSDKFNEFVKAAQVEVLLDKNSIRRTEKGRVAADLTISEAGIAVKYNVYLSENAIVFQFRSTDRSRVELAARLLRLAGVGAKMKKMGDRDEWYVEAYTRKLAAGSKELRDALAEVVKTARDKGWMNEKKAEGWLRKLERGLTLKEDWPMYYVGLVEGALVLIYRSTNPVSIKSLVQQLRDMGLEKGDHFTVKMPESGEAGYVSILRKGLERAARLSEYGSGRQRELAAEFVKYILERAKEAGEEVYGKARKIIEEGKAKGSLTLEGFEERVEVGGREHVVKVVGWSAEIEKSWSDKKLLRLTITAEVNGVRSDYMITYSRRSEDNAVEGRATASADAPGGREADAERFSALVKALTGEEPRVYRKSDGTIEIKCGRKHLDGFARYAELADAIERWLEETGRS